MKFNVGGPDTVQVHLASTLRSKEIHRHPYCGGLSLRQSAHCPWTIGDLWRVRPQRPHRPQGHWGVLGQTDTVRDPQKSTLRSKGTVKDQNISNLAGLNDLEAAGGSRGGQTLSETIRDCNISSIHGHSILWINYFQTTDYLHLQFRHIKSYMMRPLALYDC